MKIEQPSQLDVDGLADRCRRATQILVTHETERRYPNGYDAICAGPIAPPPPITRDAATPHLLFVGPFQDEPDLVAVALYVGIGFVEIRDVDGAHYTYGFSTIGGDGVAVRNAYLLTAFHLYFDDVKIIQKAGA